METKIQQVMRHLTKAFPRMDKEVAMDIAINTVERHKRQWAKYLKTIVA